MDYLDKGLQSLACETSNKKSEGEDRVDTESEKNTIGNGSRILLPAKCTVLCSTTRSEKPENEQEAEKKQRKKSARRLKQNNSGFRSRECVHRLPNLSAGVHSSLGTGKIGHGEEEIEEIKCGRVRLFRRRKS
ncbi:unnamed protein product [Microthlaspi erraticum]|uniref:Uncharacterized protein n=1 Tax=Microthlaspi erraticum TaxID=1685480 RepID=A0A6D2J3C9_9BRAS|nr:unnamed protein product [Microthlaspi erraticum]